MDRQNQSLMTRALGAVAARLHAQAHKPPSHALRERLARPWARLRRQRVAQLAARSAKRSKAARKDRKARAKTGRMGPRRRNAKARVR